LLHLNILNKKSMKIKFLQLALISTLFVACGEEDKSNNVSSTQEVELSTEEKEKVIEIENITHELEEEVETMKEEVEELDSEVEDLLKDI